MAVVETAKENLPTSAQPNVAESHPLPPEKDLMHLHQVFFNEIRSLRNEWNSFAMKYLLRKCEICLWHMKERILFHLMRQHQISQFTKWIISPWAQANDFTKQSKSSKPYYKTQKYLFCSTKTENPPFRVGEILLRNVKYACGVWNSPRRRVGGFNFTFCFSKIFYQRRKPLISPWAFANDFT